VSPVKYELGFYIPEDDILHSHCHGNLQSYDEQIDCGITQAVRVLSQVRLHAICCCSGGGAAVFLECFSFTSQF
jgi:hypothetical protein